MNKIKNISQPVLVTGANGFIGRRVVDKLLKHRISVRALVLPAEAVPESWNGRIDIIRGDITNRITVEQAMDGAKTVIHLAAIVSSWGNEKIFQDTAVKGSLFIFEEAVKNSALVVLVSSIVVYGRNIYKAVCSEDAGYGKPLGIYSRAKQSQEKLAWSFYNDKGMRLTVVRPANVYGPASAMWLHNVIESLQSGMPTLIGGGNLNAGLAYVDNVADIIILAGSMPAALGRAYNACDGLDVTWRQYFTDIAGIIGTKEPVSVPRAVVRIVTPLSENIWKALRIKRNPFITREILNLVGSDNRFPMNRVRNELGYEAVIGYEEGLGRITEYLITFRK